MRRAALAGGRRLAEQGRIQSPEHFVDAGFDEMCALLDRTGGPSAEQLADRHELRTSLTAKDAPPFLGDPPHPPPDPSGLPPGVGRVMRAMGIVIGEMFGSSEEQHEEHLVRGMAASPGVYEGPVRLIRDIEELPTVQQGEVLVASSTGSAFNVVLPLIGALVTERGGVLSHAAVVSREYGLPGIVGCVGATKKLKTGTRVRVDGDKGEVWTIG